MLTQLHCHLAMEIQTSVWKSIDSTPTAGISISGSSMKVNVDADKLPFAPEDVDAAVGFVINGSGECTTTGLGVDVVGP